MIEYIAISYAVMFLVMIGCFFRSEYEVGMKIFLFAPVSVLIVVPVMFAFFVAWLFK